MTRQDLIEHAAYIITEAPELKDAREGLLRASSVIIGISISTYLRMISNFIFGALMNCLL